MRPPPAPKPSPQPGPAAGQAAPRAADSDDSATEAAEEPARERAAPAKKKPEGPPPLSGKLAEVMALIKDGKVEEALVKALRWRAEQPGNVMALLALGEALQAHGQSVLAARVYGSIIDLFPSRADMRRFAGERLEALRKAGLDLAVDTYAQAVKQRPDHALGHRLLGIALARQGKYEEALSALEKGLTQRYRISRSGVERILREDLGLVAAALLQKNRGGGAGAGSAAPSTSKYRDELEKRLKKHGARIAEKPSLRFVLTWQTDANDVDFHIHDGKEGHAYHGNRQLPSGGVLYADVTNGYGPECFTINGTPEAYPYTLRIHYYSRGPMGYGMGKVQLMQHDGQGNLKFQDRPFVVMNDRAYVEIGEVKGPL
jgi:tetratricopeptide (TPR) repeat protein